MENIPINTPTETKHKEATRSGERKRYGRGDSRQRQNPGRRPGRPHEKRGDEEKKRGPRASNIAKDILRIIPLGGVEEVGKNMTVVEYGDDILVFDIGIFFASDDDTPGVDYVIPDTTYLEERKNKIRAVIITHGHLDHIGGIPFVMPKLGNPTIYTRELTSIMIKKRYEEFPYLKIPPIEIIEPGKKVRVGKMTVKAFPVTHSIPDSMGLSIETPHGNIVITGDLKLDHNDGVPSEQETEKWTSLGKDKNLLFIADSTNAERPDFSIPEKIVHTNLEKLVSEIPGRIIIGTFASQFERMIHIIKTCEKLGKKVVTEGRSIKTNIEIAQQANLFTPKKDTFIPAQEMSDYPPDKIVILATGAQGEEFAALMRIATGKHKYVKLTEKDTIILSSSVIPGNELDVQKLKDNLYRHGLRIIHYRASDVHSTGHGNAGELVWINQKVHAKFFMPAYGYHSMLRCHASAVVEAGFPRDHVIIPDNGSIIEFYDEGRKFKILSEKASAGIVMIDSLGLGDIKEVVVRDRKALAQDGMFVIVAVIDIKSGKVKKSPDIISRGFVYLKESQDLLNQTRLLVKKTVEDSVGNMHPINFDYVKNNVRERIGRFLYQQTKKRPMILPVILEV